MDPQTACPVNIGPGERRKRTIVGIIGVAAATLWVSLVWKGWVRPPDLYYVVTLPLFIGVLGLLQSFAGT